MKCVKIMAVMMFFIAGCSGTKDDIRAMCADPLTAAAERFCEEYLRDVS